MKQTNIYLKPEPDDYSNTRRDDWRCYEVLHAGEGPCRNGQLQGGINPCLPSEVAEWYGEHLADVEQREYGPGDDGDSYHVAVETREGYALYYEVTKRLIRRFEAFPSNVEVEVPNVCHAD